MRHVSRNNKNVNMLKYYNALSDLNCEIRYVISKQKISGQQASFCWMAQVTSMFLAEQCSEV